MDGNAARVAKTETGAEGIKIASRAHKPALIKVVPTFANAPVSEFCG